MDKTILADLIFTLLEEAAAKGQRCPTNPELAAELGKQGIPSAAQSMPSNVKLLTTQGRIAVQIYGNNWREVIILSGTHKGKKTLPPKHGGEPYIVIDKTGTKKRYLYAAPKLPK
jgi:hypothetical protein